jgi:hypothetical protein
VSTIHDAIYEQLVGDAAVAELVDDRIYIGIAPPTVLYPLVQFSQVAGSRLPILTGDRMRMPLIQVDSYAARGVAAEAGYVNSEHVQAAARVAGAVEDAMTRKPFVALEDLAVTNCFLESEREILEEGGSRARVSQDYRVWWERR